MATIPQIVAVRITCQQLVDMALRSADFADIDSASVESFIQARFPNGISSRLVLHFNDSIH